MKKEYTEEMIVEILQKIEKDSIVGDEEFDAIRAAAVLLRVYQKVCATCGLMGDG